MTGFNWPVLLRIALTHLHLKPYEFWALTPVEFRLMLGHDLELMPLTHHDISAMEALFSDFEQGL